ncbi:MAG: hypothetical protein HYY14_03110 [Candidatus Omnitrophica bacterium]|nr:hypothetical protein [Candidatus Omnitrophota bacterium]
MLPKKKGTGKKGEKKEAQEKPKEETRSEGCSSWDWDKKSEGKSGGCH